MKWYVVLPLTLLVAGGFGLMAWGTLGGEMPEFSLGLGDNPRLSDEELATEQVIELIPDEPTSTAPTARELKAKRAEEALKERQAEEAAKQASSTVATTTEQVEEILTAESFSDTILKLHNNERADVEQQPLTWSASLSETADAWAGDLSVRGCELEHSNTAVGENLFYGWTTGELTIDPARALTSWIDEKANYDYATNECAAGAVCGHYTQIVWANTTEVGCGFATCEDGEKNGQLWVCQYSPAGNIIGQPPY